MVFSGSSTNKTNHHEITAISLKVALNTIIVTLTLKFVSDSGRSVCQVGDFLRCPPLIKLIRHDIAEILLKVALKTTTNIMIKLHELDIKLDR